MNITQEEIINLIKYTSRLIGSRVDILPEDIVNDAILQALESGEDINLKDVIKKLIYGEKNIGRSSGRKDDLYRAYNTKETTKYCKGCNQDLPIGSFYVLRYKKINKEIIQHICKDCKNKYYQKRRQTDESYRLKINKESSERQRRKTVEDIIKGKKYLKKAHSILESQVALKK